MTALVDTDGDGLTDKLRVFLGSNPNDADTDDDGVIDGLEPNLSDDTDGDGFPQRRRTATTTASSTAPRFGLPCSIRRRTVEEEVRRGRGSGDEDEPAPPRHGQGRRDRRRGRREPQRQARRDRDRSAGGNGADDTGSAKNTDTGWRRPHRRARGRDRIEQERRTATTTACSTVREANPAEDTDGDGKANVIDPDSDGDLFDGTETRRSSDDAATDKTKNNCIAGRGSGHEDEPARSDTDKGGVSDGTGGREPQRQGRRQASAIRLRRRTTTRARTRAAAMRTATA